MRTKLSGWYFPNPHIGQVVDPNFSLSYVEPSSAENRPVANRIFKEFHLKNYGEVPFTILLHNPFDRLFFEI